jgi:hypothetical protein
MLKTLGLFIGIALAVAALGGCDDRDSGKQGANGDKQKDAAASAPVRFGAGWHAVADSRQSSWGFAQANAPTSFAGDPNNLDALAGIRTALMANMLPAHNSVRIEALVNRALSSISPSISQASPADRSSENRPMVVLTTTPWNDDSLLLWVEVPGLTAPGNTTIAVEFDPSAVAAFRTLGDPSALPSPIEIPGGVTAGRAAMLYELLLQRTDPAGKGGSAKLIVKYGVLHVGGPADSAAKLDQSITTNDAVGTIDNAPEVVRFATAAAGFGGLLRGDPSMRDLSCNDVIALAQSVRQPDTDGWRAQLVALMYRAEPLIDLPPAR